MNARARARIISCRKACAACTHRAGHRPVEPGVGEQALCRDVLLVDPVDEDGQLRIQRVVHRQLHRLVDGLQCKAETVLATRAGPGFG